MKEIKNDIQKRRLRRFGHVTRVREKDTYTQKGKENDQVEGPEAVGQTILGNHRNERGKEIGSKCKKQEVMTRDFSGIADPL